MVGGMVFADQSDLYWFGYGVGIFHSAADSASGRAAVAAVWVRDDGGMAVSARGEISIFCGRRCYAVVVVSVLCAAGSYAAVQFICGLTDRAAGGRAVFAPVVLAVCAGGAADWRDSDE